jgi:hypothetical protein
MKGAEQNQKYARIYHKYKKRYHKNISARRTYARHRLNTRKLLKAYFAVA